jgi:hypothetical protein
MSKMQAFYDRISRATGRDSLLMLARVSRAQILEATRNSVWLLWGVSPS